MKNFDIDSFLNSSFKNLKSSKPKTQPQQQTNIIDTTKRNTQVKKVNEDNSLNNVSHPWNSATDFSINIDSSIYNELHINTIESMKKIPLVDLIKPWFPNETVYANEFTSDKVFVLDKFIKNKQKRIKPQKENYTRHWIAKIKKEKMDYESMTQMTVLWSEYITSWMNGTNNIETINSKLLKCDWHGAIVEVIASVNKNNIGIKGILVFETRKTFNLWTTQNKIKTIWKQGCIFKIELPYNNWSVKIWGDNFLYKSAERTKAKFKTKYNLNLKLLSHNQVNNDS